ncbi:MAG TPA: NAD-dependent epimerase/dehydratase family protein [Candidatus Sulfopaludibacter sp.]|nr:NAD-dependent epimerase/dehydratase family protein [Candidatus Sulfopaludibacter sp.]
MKLLITGICGFAGSTIACSLQDQRGAGQALTILGVDNLSRAGSEINRRTLKQRGIKLVHGDLRLTSDLDALPACDWVIDAAANPSVLAGVDGKTSSRQILDHNLASTINVLEFCKRHKAGFILLSTSRVYSIPALAGLPLREKDGAFVLDSDRSLPGGVSARGVTEEFSSAPPLSLYGAGKLASETIALEYGEAFDFPVWINRCGLLAGAGQFGRADQGIVSFWINACLRRHPLKYIGFGGCGHQTRDVLHPRDLVPLLRRQFDYRGRPEKRLFNLGGGPANSFSLQQLSRWCAERFASHKIDADPAPRPFDIPWLIMDSNRAGTFWGWSPQTKSGEIFDEVARHAREHEDWLDRSADI